MNNGKRGRREKSFNWKDTKDRDQAYLHDTFIPLTKLVFTWYNGRESECTSRGDIESRISFDFLRSRKLFPPLLLALISVTEKKRERESPHIPWLKEKHTDVSPSPIFVFFLTIVNPSRWICRGWRGRETMLLNQLETSKRILIRDIMILKTGRK